MKIEQTANNLNLNRISSYSGSSFTVNERVYSNSILIAADKLISPWSANTFDGISLQHIEHIISFEPEIIVIGTGKNVRFLPEAYRATSLSRNIGMEFMDSGGACRCYNLLLDEGRKVVAALLLPEAN